MHALPDSPSTQRGQDRASRKGPTEGPKAEGDRGPEGHDGRRKAGDQEGEPRDKTGFAKSPSTGYYPLSVT